MKTLSKIYILLICSVVINFANQENEQIANAKNLIKSGILQWQEVKFHQAAALCERVFQENENPYAKYYQTRSQSMILQMAMVSRDEEKFNNFFETAVENAKSLLDNKDLQSEAEVLLAHIYMSKLSITPNDAPVLSGKIHSHLDKALEINTENPRALIIKATMLFYTPKMFGGDPQKAINLFEKAKLLLAKPVQNKISPNWGYCDLMATLATAYLSSGELEKAKKVCEETMIKEPEFGRVKFSILPAIEKKMKESETK
ncbi:MAG: tetratricopeptide repeat protein [Rhodothermaceae bacterium]